MKHILQRNEEIILRMVKLLGNDAYVSAIWKKQNEIMGTPNSVGATATTLIRLEDRQLVVSVEKESTNLPRKPGDRRRKFFRITEEGNDKLNAADQVMLRLQAVLGNSPETAKIEQLKQ